MRIMSTTNKHTTHATRAKGTDESLYLCNKNSCRQIPPTTEHNQLKRILNTEHPAKLHVLYCTCGTMWIVCSL